MTNSRWCKGVSRIAFVNGEQQADNLGEIRGKKIEVLLLNLSFIFPIHTQKFQRILSTNFSKKSGTIPKKEYLGKMGTSGVRSWGSCLDTPLIWWNFHQDFFGSCFAVCVCECSWKLIMYPNRQSPRPNLFCWKRFSQSKKSKIISRASLKW